MKANNGGETNLKVEVETICEQSEQKIFFELFHAELLH